MKRILCTLLVLTMLLSAMPAFAKDYLETYKYMDQIFRFDVGDFVTGSGDDAASGGVDADQATIDFLDFLGIWDDASLKPNSHVTKTEFSIIMANLKLGKDNPLEDVYLINTDDTKVTYKEAYKQIITTLGYYYKCEQHSNPEDWILFVADEIDLLVSTPNNMDEYITRAELAKIVTKALNIDLSVVEYTDYGYNYTVSEGETLLNTVHNLVDVSGFVNAVYGVSVYGGNDCREGFFQINRRNIKTSGLELNHYLGRVVKAYATYDELRDEYSIAYIDYETEIEYLEINFADITEISNDTIYYLDENGADCEIAVNNLNIIAENGRVLNSLDEMSSFTQNEGKIILTSSEKYGDMDTAVIYTYTYAIIEYNDMLEHKIGLKNGQKYNGQNFIPFDEKAVMNISLDGEKIDITTLPTGIAMRFFKNELTGYIEIIASTKTLIGEVTSYDGEYYGINEELYRPSKNMLKLIEEHASDSSIPASQKVKELDLGLSTTFYVIDGLIVGYASANEYKYGYLKTVSQARTGIDPDITLKIFSQDGEWLELKITKPIELDGEKNVEKSEVYTFLRNDATKEGRNYGNSAVGNLVRFKASGDMLVALDTVIESRFETDTDEDLTFNTYNTYDTNWTEGYLDIGYPYLMTAQTIYFAIPKDRNEEDLYSMTSVTGIKDIAGSQGTMDSYFFNTNELCIVGAVLIDGTINEIKGNADSGGATYYITKIMNAVIDADNEEYGYKVEAEKLSSDVTVGIAYKTTKSSFYVSKDLFERNPLNVGDLVAVNTSGGKATSWTVRLPGGRVPTETFFNNPQRDGIYEAVGHIKALDASIDRVVVDIGELYNSSGDLITQYHPVLCRSKLVINPDTNKLESTTLSSFHVGDMVWVRPQYGNTIIVKNVFD